MEADGGGGQLHTDAEAGDRQALFDADRGHLFDHGAGDGGDGAGRARGGEGGGRDRDRGDGGHAQVGGDGRGDVSQAAGRGAGGGQHRGAATGRGQGRRAARAGAGQAGLDQTPQEVQGRGVCADQGRGGRAHAVLPRAPA